MAIEILDLKKTRWNPENGGFGYLGHSARSEQTDEALVESCNLLEMSAEEMFLWANSSFARHLMDKLGRGASSSELMTDIEKHLPDLLSEVLSDRTKAADEFGRKAFKDGKVCTPALDLNVMTLLNSLRPGACVKVLDAWLAGWHAENLKAD